MLEPQLVVKPVLTVVGLEAPFISVLSPDANNANVIGQLWDKFMQRADKVPNRVGHASFGVIYARPEAERKHPHEMQYVAGVAVGSTADVPSDMVVQAVPSGTFAVFTHRGPISKIGETVAGIHRDWLPQSAYRQSQNTEVEMYDERFCCEGETSAMEIWIPVTPNGS